jgi:hypothetical protein
MTCVRKRRVGHTVAPCRGRRSIVFEWCHCLPKAVFWELPIEKPVALDAQISFRRNRKEHHRRPHGAAVADDIHASDAADRLASELYEIRPELRVRECAVLVTDDDGEEVHRAPIVEVH